jgi:hypothetical protein
MNGTAESFCKEWERRRREWLYLVVQLARIDRQKDSQKKPQP